MISKRAVILALVAALVATQSEFLLWDGGRGESSSSRPARARAEEGWGGGRAAGGGNGVCVCVGVGVGGSAPFSTLSHACLFSPPHRTVASALAQGRNRGGGGVS